VALVQHLRGEVQALRGEERRAIAQGETVYVGEGLETGTDSSLSVTTYPGYAILSLGGDSSLKLLSPAEVEVARGRLQATVPDSVVQAIITPHGRIVTRETKLSVVVRPNGTELQVTEGDARVEGPRGLRQVVPTGATMFLSAEPVTVRD
jgi:hypothetical protein